MHEMSIAMQLLDSVLAAAAEHGAARVESAEVHVGAMRLVVPEALKFAWEVACEGTPAEGSSLEIVETPLRGRCFACGAEYEPRLDDFLCPACGQADVEIVEGNDIVLRSVVCASEEGASAP
jgi:hydrogenase nickel incorporation protein HypA/HybF